MLLCSRLFACLILVLSMAAVAGTSAADPVRIFAAASLKNALDETASAWKAKTGKEAVASYAASSALAKQIEQAAPADIFMSADLDWMDYLDKRNLIKGGTRKNLLGNQIVLVAAAGSGFKLDLKAGADLAGALAGEKLAMGEVKSVPAGKYGEAALEKLGLWASVEKNVAMSENVRAALALVARGEAKLGIVYASDARVEPKVEVAGVFPEDSHPPIIYPVALVASGMNPDAAEFLAFLSTPDAAAIFKAQGFTLLP
jgi:molybdate transport system substrate-binding protein